MQSALLEQKKKDDEGVETYTLNARESEQLTLITQRITYARNQREMPRDEFDGLGYEQAYLLNKRAMMSYLAPKKNDDEVRINTGTTEKRIELVLNELLALNIQEEINAYDKDDNKLQELSEVFTDIVRRTEQMEMAEEKDIWIYQELISQPSVFVEEVWSEKQIKGKKGAKTVSRCERRLLKGVQVYLGDVSIPDYRFQDQPYLLKYARMTYAEGKTIFGQLDRWQYVTKGSYGKYFPLTQLLYRKGSLISEEIEIWEYMDAANREYQLMINGVPMYQPGEDLPWDWDGYNMEMVSLKPLSNDFAYGRPLTASAKTLQALNNETIRNLIRKFRQALEPPMGVVGNKMFSRDIWNPGAIIQGIKKDDFQKLIDHQGVTQSELAMYDLIEKKVNEFIGTNQGDPLQNKSAVTATELVQAQKMAVKMLGLAVLSVMRLKNKLAMLRIKNILSNYTKATGKEVNPVTKKLTDTYARFTLEGADLANGKQGNRVIQLTDQSLTPQGADYLFQQEQVAKKRGIHVEYKTVNVKLLDELGLYFYVNSVSKEKESSELDKVMFTDELNQAGLITQMTGVPLSKNKVIDKFERIWKSKDLFERDVPQMMQQQMQSMQQGQMGQPPGGMPMNPARPARPTQPSINTMATNM